MIARQKFRKLGVRQRIYKVAESVREIELHVAAGEEADFLPFSTYYNYLHDEPHALVDETDAVINRHLGEIEELAPRELARRCNLAFYELLALLGKEQSEGFYRTPGVKVFDGGPRQVRRFETAGILDNLRSSFNVGSIFRASDCLGVGELALCGITDKPPSVKLSRTAMGTIETVKWTYFETTKAAVEHFRARGWRVYAVETAHGAVSLSALSDYARTAFVFGNEEFGVSEEILALCDACVEIPMMGVKNSLNVSNCFSVVMYEAGREMVRETD
jgi:tRNA(Leu) C34 or U34 (ribose-2'-O)-methylase TrmL